MPLYLPRWTSKLLDEAQSTHLKLGWKEQDSQGWRRAVESAFPEAIVTGYEAFEPLIANDPKDRHVVAAAMRAHASLIVTFNIKHFGKEFLEAFGIRAEHPSDYLITLYEIDPAIVVARLSDIGQKRSLSPKQALARLEKSVPDFVEHVAEALDWDFRE